MAYFARRRFALERRWGGHGRKSRDRPRWIGGVVEWARHPGTGLHATWPSLVRQPDIQAHARCGGGEEAAGSSPLPPGEASRHKNPDLVLRLRPNATAAAAPVPPT